MINYGVEVKILLNKSFLRKQLKSGPFAPMAAERTSLHRRSQTVLQEIRKALPTHTYQGPWPKRNWLIIKQSAWEDTHTWTDGVTAGVADFLNFK